MLTVKPCTRLKALVTAGVLIGATGGSSIKAQDRIVGSELFRFYCAPCHGAAGRGDGPAAPALKSVPPDLTALSRVNGGAFPRDRVRAAIAGTGRPLVAHGSSDMPIWGAMFLGVESSASGVRQRIETLVSHVEALQLPAATGSSGGQLFRTYCASCHGENGHGDGPLARRLRHVPPDLTRYTEMNHGVFPSERLYRIIDGREVPSHGDRDMPVWGDAFRSTPDGRTAEQARARIEAIVGYLRAIQRRDAE
jgi:mono/diheme cytochrome c family protein